MGVGDIVRWYETYAEGITKCSGLGSVQRIKVFSFKEYDPIFLYEVWRFDPYNDIRTFENQNIELAIDERST